MKIQPYEKGASAILSVLGNPFRLQVALALSDQEACVCHLENLLQKRQAFISQHLMALREAGLLETRREGKFIFYRLANPAILELIRNAAAIAGVKTEPSSLPASNKGIPSCACPHCGEKGANQKQTAFNQAK